MNIRLGRRIRRKNAGIDFMSVDLPLKVNNTGESGLPMINGLVWILLHPNARSV